MNINLSWNKKDVIRWDKYEFLLKNKNCKINIIDSNRYIVTYIESKRNTYVIIDEGVYKNKWKSIILSQTTKIKFCLYIQKNLKILSNRYMKKVIS